ncbi:MAG: hypothetical protein A2W51_00395 [Candidatus Zambryskibacteria bacterium RIFCSPHIGHO2_02_39_10]|nr:MAG: hypothetical protein A2W51_00395 [Candidatus Zambryskibacteria bacterium RIFCSPHIGHO2_02_39_10]
MAVRPGELWLSEGQLARVARVESQIDICLRKNHETGVHVSTPVRLKHVPHELLLVVAQRYREIGWKVQFTSDGFIFWT